MQGRSRKLRIIALAAAVICLGGLAAVGVAMRESFAKLHFARVFPLGYVPQNDASPIGSIDLAIYGDSRAYLWDRSSLPVANVANLAHGGITSTQLLLQLRSGPPPRSSWALVQIGINDLHPLGVLGEHRDAVLAGLEQNLTAIVSLLSEHSDRVVVTTIVPPGPVPLTRRFVWDAETPDYVQKMNAVIRSLPSSHSKVTVLDASNLLAGDAEYLPSRYVDDDFFLHLNADAYAVLNRELARLISGASDARQ